jgi:hypothetical protein
MSKLLASVRRNVGRRLSIRQKLWLKRTFWGEHAWQRRPIRLRQTLQKQQLTQGAALNLNGAPAVLTLRGSDAHSTASENLDLVRANLKSNGLRFVELPQMYSLRPHLVIHQADTTTALASLLQLPSADGWNVTVYGEGGQVLSHRRATQHPEKVFALHAFRRFAGTNGRVMSTPAERVIIEPWEELGDDVARADGSLHLSGTLRRRIQSKGLPVEYLSPKMQEDAHHQGAHKLEWPAPHLYEVTSPVDLVYTWVDGSDARWLSRKSEAMGNLDSSAVNDTALTDSRFLSHEELKYSLRSVEAYANWVNHIYIVTDRQVPAWLNTQHPKISIVDHSDIFTDPSALPVFNSHAIESQLHHIPGLSEHYLYMNDDLFFLRPVNPDLFFTSSGLSKFFPSTAPLDMQEPSAADLPVLSAAKQGRNFMTEVHGRTVSNKFKHTPHPQLKSVLQQMEHEHPELFDRVAKSKFRHPSDYSIASALVHFHAYATKQAVRGRIRYAYLDIGAPEAQYVLDSLLRRDDLQVLCLNDTDIAAQDRARVSDLLGTFLSSRFPVASSFEI